jgi:hypothetical protein
MTEQRNGPHELSSAGMRRREQMLPLLQDAVKGRVRRRRQRRVVGGSLLVLLVSFGLIELIEESRPVLENVGTYLADGAAGSKVPPVQLETTDVLQDGALDIRSSDSEAFYARALERSPDLFITTPDRLPASASTTEPRGVVEYLTTEQLMVELSIAGMDSAVICSERGCTLFTFGGRTRNVDEEANATSRKIAQGEASSIVFASVPTLGTFKKVKKLLL